MKWIADLTTVKGEKTLPELVQQYDVRQSASKRDPFVANRPDTAVRDQS